VIGDRLVPLLVAAGHQVAGMTRTPAKADRLIALGAQPVDVFELDAVAAAVDVFAPEVVLHHLTDLPDDRARMPDFAEATIRMYRQGTSNLVAAAGKAGAGRVVAQSIAWRLLGEVGEALEAYERAVLDNGGRRRSLRPVLRPGDLLRGRAATAAAGARPGLRPSRGRPTPRLKSPGATFLHAPPRASIT
jgi:putative NADH-flavin reductase